MASQSQKTPGAKEEQPREKEGGHPGVSKKTKETINKGGGVA